MRKINLRQAGKDDVETAWRMQTEAFRELYEKINDRMDIVFYEKN